MGAPRDDVVLPTVPLVLLLVPAGRLGAPQGPRRALEIAFLALRTSQLTTENFSSRLDARGPGHRAPLLVVLLVWFLRDLGGVSSSRPLNAEVDMAAVADARRALAADPVVVLPETEAPADEAPEDTVDP